MTIIQQMHKEENDVRSRYRKYPFKLDKGLCKKAQAHADWMAKNHRYEHSGMNNEIIHRGPTTARSAVYGWWASPAHLGIILLGTKAGHGHAVNSNVHYWVSLVK